LDKNSRGACARTGFTVRHGVWAAEASQRLRSEILTARLAFSLGEEFRLEVSEGEIRIQG
jgi:hypothetical protein